MNKATPIFKPLCTAKVWFPKYVPSLITSRHQNVIEAITEIKANIKKLPERLKLCIVNTPLVVNVNKESEVYMGHGDGDTK
jgi:hypothetical protein